MSEDKILNKFYNTFRGNTSFFVRHQAPFSEEEEGGKIKAAYVIVPKYNNYDLPPEGSKEGDYIPVTKELYKEHLNGGNGLAIAPLMDTKDRQNVCFYAAIDIDVYDVNFTWLVNRLHQAGFKFTAFLSKSGGLHIYFFFGDPEPADKTVEVLEKIVEVYGLRRLFVNEKNKSKVEIFPKQTARVSGSKIASCLFLPFYNAANKSTQNMLTPEGKLVGIVKALPVIKSMFTTVKELNRVLDGLPYSDAPYCVQTVLLTGALAENDGRNNFLFSAAVYLKKKYRTDFEAVLQEMNDCFEVPLEQKDVDSVYRSVTTNSYDGYGCKKSPCADYCDKRLCALREYGVGRRRGNHVTGADCWGELSKVMAEEPYYSWKVRINPDEDFREVHFDGVDDLHNQAVIQKRCWRDLNWAPFRVKDNDWIATVNKAMEGIENREILVPKGTDTTAMGELRGLFTQFLTQRRSQNGQPVMVMLNQVYCSEGMYYFSTQGILTFLRHEKFFLGKLNLREQLIAYGCSEAELRYKNAKGEEKVIECWKKPDDDELSAMDAFYEDAHEADMEILQSVKPKKEQSEGGSDEGVKF
jgi:hypothetical protein